MATRSKTRIWLIGQPEENLPGNVLPTVSDVLKVYMYHHSVLKKTVSDSLKATTEELMEIWNKARVVIAYQPNIVTKMKLLVEEYNLLKKNKSRASEAQKCREDLFSHKLHLLFDIAHKDAEKIIRIEEDKAFLQDQRGPRKMRMSGLDADLSKREERVRERKMLEEERKQREEQRKAMASTSVSLVSSLESVDVGSDEGSLEEDEQTADYDDFEIEIPIYYRKQLTNAVSHQGDSSSSTAPKKSCVLQNMLTSPDVSSALDRINLSDRKFTILAAAIAKADGQDIEEAPLSHSTVYRKRSSHRSCTDQNVREEFLTTEKPLLVVHWDGKLMKDFTNKEDSKAKVDRISVVVTGNKVEKILGIAKIQSGTGEAQSAATYHLLALWEVVDDIIAMSFDTTASNTGAAQGACVLLEKKLKRKLLYLACRHHIHELLIAGVFTTLFGASTGPNIPLFKRFQEFWPNINQQQFKPLDDDRLNTPENRKLREDVTRVLQGSLLTKEGYIPRDDYRELMKLCLIILGVSTIGNKNYHFKLPGAYHLARWMTKVIYCFKIYLFRSEFQLTSKEEKNLKEFCLFASIIYVKSWVLCPLTADAPINDLILFKQIKEYEVVNKAVSQDAMKKFKSHLWYLGPELVLLSLFSDKLPVEEKRQIISKIKEHREDWSKREIKLANIEGLEKKSLQDLVTCSSICALRSLHIDVDFIFENDPETWMNSPSYENAKTVIMSLKVINDVAERSVALMSAYNNSITKKESEMQKLIQVVEDHRKRIPDVRKKSLKAYKPR